MIPRVTNSPSAELLASNSNEITMAPHRYIFLTVEMLVVLCML